jgi:hypothetical protein
MRKTGGTKICLKRDLYGQWHLTVNESHQCGSVADELVNDVPYIAGATLFEYRGLQYYLDLAAPEVPASLANYVRQFKVRADVDPNTIDATIGDGVCANSSGACSLTAAFQEANVATGAKVIVVPAGTYAITSTLVAGATGANGVYSQDPQAAASGLFAIYGDGPASTIISGGSPQGVLTTAYGFASYISGQLSYLILQNLSVNGGNSNVAFGASGVNIYGSAHIKNCVFENHSGFDPVIYAGVTSHEILIEQSRLRNNQTTAVGAFGPQSLIIKDSEMISNTGYGVDISNGTYHVEVQNSTVANNGYGIKYRKCYHECLVENSTISGNGNYGFSVAMTQGQAPESMRIRNSTITNNGLTAGSNISINVPATAAGESLRIENSIISRGSSPRPNCDINVATTNYPLLATNSMVDDGSCGGTGFSMTDPLLLPLAYNGGFSLTHALAANSPALDSGLNAICTALDQRGFLRPVQKTGASALCDMGAYEQQ